MRGYQGRLSPKQTSFSSETNRQESEAAAARQESEGREIGEVGRSRLVSRIAPSFVSSIGDIRGRIRSSHTGARVQGRSLCARAHPRTPR